MGETSGGVRWITKEAIALKRVKIEEKLPWRAYGNLLTLFRTIPSPTPYGLLFPKNGGSQPPPEIPIAIISLDSAVDATDLTTSDVFWYARRVLSLTGTSDRT